MLEAARARAQALADRDVDRLADVLHEEFRWRTHTGDTFDRAEYLDRNTTGPVRWISQEFRGASVTVVGDTAVLHAEVVDVIETADGHETFRMPMTQVWVRERGRWRCLAGHAGPRRR